ncbi:MAG: ABC transporter ATP-binding protein [Burkholderiales bacterium]|nr:ABC transporter ATP-binding protein [Burkholderiaceae bacterium]
MATDGPEPLLALRNVETCYGPVLAIQGVSMDVPAGSIVTLLGSNGAGKSTVLKSISGFAEPRKGTIRFAGRELVGREPDATVALGLLHVPEGREVFPFLTVRENLLMGAYTRRDRDAVHTDLERMHDLFPILRERAAQPAMTLSGGEQQMLAIARALMASPRLLLLDEPSLGLSPRLVGEIFTIIRRINVEAGTTILLVEQNARKALEVADFGYVIEVGRIVMKGPAAELVRKADIREFYLGVKQVGARASRRWKRTKLWR